MKTLDCLNSGAHVRACIVMFILSVGERTNCHRGKLKSCRPFPCELYNIQPPSASSSALCNTTRAMLARRWLSLTSSPSLKMDIKWEAATEKHVNLANSAKPYELPSLGHLVLSLESFRTRWIVLLWTHPQCEETTRIWMDLPCSWLFAYLFNWGCSHHISSIKISRS